MSRAKVSRERLFELVWNHPIDEVADSITVSPDELEKICKRYLIPSPRSVAAARANPGEPLVKPPLPYFPSDLSWIDVAKLSGLLAEGTAGDLEGFELERNGNGPIHRWVSRAKEKLVSEVRRKSADKYERFSTGRSGYLGISVTSKLDSFSRALLLWNEMVHLVESRGFSVEARQQSDAWRSYERVCVVIRGIEIHLWLFERTTRTNTFDRHFADSPQFKSTGQFYFQIESPHVPGSRTNWGDQRWRSLESQLHSLVDHLVHIAEVMEKENAETEARRQEIEKRNRVRKGEERRRRHLESCAETFQRCEAMRTFLAEIKARERMQRRSRKEKAAFDLWATWASEYIDSIDPVRAWRLPDFDVPQDGETVSFGNTSYTAISRSSPL